jgi:glycosyltransferase involved in cell wall biosynthesis
MKTLSAVFPAYNEQSNIENTVQAALRVLPNLAESWEIIVVDDGSRDETGRICDDLARRCANFHVIHHPFNRGYGAALKSGLLGAKYDLIFFSDSDGQFDLNEISDLMKWTGEYEIVAGYRKKRRDPVHRRLNAWAWNGLIRVLLGVRVRDINCAFKIFRREIIEKIRIESIGAMVNTEILAQATRLGMRIKEVPVNHFSRRHGKQTGANPLVIAKAFRELFGMWQRLRRIEPAPAGIFQPWSAGPNGDKKNKSRKN